MKGYRKLRVGEVIRKGDVFMLGDVVEPAVMIGLKIDDDFKPHYRPLPAKKVEMWKVSNMDGGDKSMGGDYWIVKDKYCERARVWSLKDARLICRAINNLRPKAE